MVLLSISVGFGRGRETERAEGRRGGEHVNGDVTYIFSMD
jgi:hypothetical protein